MHSKKAMDCVCVYMTSNAFKTFEVLRSTQMPSKKAMNCVLVTSNAFKTFEVLRRTQAHSMNGS